MMTVSTLYTEYTITTGGVIEASYTVNGTEKVFHKYENSEYCVDRDYNLSQDTILVCKKDSACEEEVRSRVKWRQTLVSLQRLVSVLYPALLILSSVFFLLTIVYYCGQRDVPTLIDKITVGYLVNNFLNFLFIILRQENGKWAVGSPTDCQSMLSLIPFT